MMSDGQGRNELAILLIGEENPVSEDIFGRIENYQTLDEELSMGNTMMLLLFFPLETVSAGADLSRTQICRCGVWESRGCPGKDI